MTKDAWENESFANEWDEAAQYHTNPDRLPQLSLLSRLIQQACPRSSKLLDLGIGSGQLEAFLFSQYPDFFTHRQVIGLDSSDAMLAKAKERLDGLGIGSKIRITKVDFSELESCGVLDQFDCIVCMQALHEVPDNIKRSLFRWVAKRLSHAGVFLIADRFTYDHTRFSNEFIAVWDSMCAELPSGLTSMDFERYHQVYSEKSDYITSVNNYQRWLTEAGFETTLLYQKFNRAIIAGRIAL